MQPYFLQRRPTSFGLILILILTSFYASADALRTLNLFVLDSQTEAGDAWKPIGGSPAAIRETTAPGGTRFPCNFMPNLERVYWDRATKLDLSNDEFLELDLTCENPSAIRTMGLYLQSGDGWYLWLVNLSESGRQTITFALRDAATEGKPAGLNRIRNVRLSFTRGSTGNASIAAHALRAGTSTLLLVRGTLSIASDGERNAAANTARRISRWLNNKGVRHGIIDDEAVIAGRLRTASAAILPYNALPPESELRALEAFLKRGGKLIVCYSAEPRLAALMGFRLGQYQAARAPGQWSSFTFNSDAPPYMPKIVYQESSNIMPAYPADAKAQIIAWWQNAAGKQASEPAWVQSPQGWWMAHILLEGDSAGKENMLLALLGSCLPTVWEQAAGRAATCAGKIADMPDMRATVETISRMARKAAAADQVEQLLIQAQAEHQALSNNIQKQRHAQTVRDEQRLRQTLIEAYARAQQPQKQEFRAVWDHTGLGLYPGDWRKTCRILADTGINVILPNVVWAGLAHYASAILPQSDNVTRYGDQLKDCAKAARESGLEIHVWKVCWNLGNAPTTFIAKMRKTGRTQIAANGNALNWLCPTHPENISLELNSINEALAHAPVQGIHLDYIRYPDQSACFCDGCRRRFERDIGESVANWPKSAYSGKYKESYQTWRSAQMTGFVRTLRRNMRKNHPNMRLSAAVYPEYPGCITSIGQDWGNWLKDDLVDFVCPMNYTTDSSVFANMAQRQMNLTRAAGKIFPGIGVSASESQLPADKVIEQILQTRAAGTKGFTLFDLNPPLERDILPYLKMGVTAPTRQ